MANRSFHIDQNLPAQRRSWTVQRAAWVFVAICLVAALCGLFGDGPLAAATATSAD